MVMIRYESSADTRLIPMLVVTYGNRLAIREYRLLAVILSLSLSFSRKFDYICIVYSTAQLQYGPGAVILCSSIVGQF